MILRAIEIEKSKSQEQWLDIDIYLTIGQYINFGGWAWPQLVDLKKSALNLTLSVWAHDLVTNITFWDAGVSANLR